MEKAKDTSQKPIPLEHPFIEKIPEYGEPYLDAKPFNDIDELAPFTQSLLQCKIIKISLYYGFYQCDLHGIQLTYKNVETGKIFNTTLRSKKHIQTRCQAFELGHDEYLNKVEVTTGNIIEKLSFHTSKQRIISYGTSTNTSYTYPTDNNTVIAGTYGAYSDQGLYSFGLYVAPLTEVRYWKRRTYILMRTAINRRQYMKEKVEKFVKQDSEDDDNYSENCEKAFALLAMSSHQIFVRVLRYV